MAQVIFISAVGAIPNPLNVQLTNGEGEALRVPTAGPNRNLLETFDLESRDLLREILAELKKLNFQLSAMSEVDIVEDSSFYP